MRLTRYDTLAPALASGNTLALATMCHMDEREGPVPPWVQVTAILRERIQSGELPPGAMVPSIVSIHQEFGVAKTTARKVLAQLREEGLITTTPGWGSFVTDRN